MKDSHVFLWLILCLIFGGLFYLLSPIITPFLLALLLAYLGDPIIDRLEALHIPRTAAVVIVFAGILLTAVLIVVVLIPAISGQIDRMTAKLPDYGTWFKHSVVPKLSHVLNLSPQDLNTEEIVKSLKKDIGTSSGMLKNLLIKLTGSANYLITLCTYLLLIPVITFYLLRDWDILLKKTRELIPRAYLDTAEKLLSRSDEVLGGFLRGQMLVMLGLGIIYSLGLTVLGLDLAIVIGMFAGLISFVPYLGLIVGIILAGLMALVQFQDIAHPVGVIVIFMVAQAIEGMILTPKFVGNRIGLHPVAVLFSVLAGGQLFGFTGILLALPVTAVINVFLGHIKETYLQSDVYLEPDDNARQLPPEQYINY